jgi:ribosome-associated protein
MIDITDRCSVPESELQVSFIRSPGPGGQNVNKVSTGVQLRWDVAHTTALPPDVKGKLMRLAGSRMTSAGELIITAHSFRTQEANRTDALERLAELVRKAFFKPKRRIKTRPTAASRKQRVEHKKRRGEIKRDRRLKPGE